MPTGSSIVSDIVDIARNIKKAQQEEFPASGA